MFLHFPSFIYIWITLGICLELRNGTTEMSTCWNISLNTRSFIQIRLSPLHLIQFSFFFLFKVLSLNTLETILFISKKIQNFPPFWIFAEYFPPFFIHSFIYLFIFHGNYHIFFPVLLFNTHLSVKKWTPTKRNEHQNSIFFNEMRIYYIFVLLFFYAHNLGIFPFFPNKNRGQIFFYIVFHCLVVIMINKLSNKTQNNNNEHTKKKQMIFGI